MSTGAAPKNLLILMTDEHNPKVMGCAGHQVVKTPNLDRLAANGTRFSAAYTNSPICIPARASFATGRYVHQTGNWDNAFPYTGAVPGWGHALQARGIPVTSIGKLHYRNEDDPTGFDRQINPMHVVNGAGDVLGAVRDPLPVREKCRMLSEELGPGESAYINYDRDITDEALTWLRDAARHPGDKPWVLFVSFVCPHFPLIAPPEFFEAYDPDVIDLPKPASLESARHPWIEAMRNCFIYDRFFTNETRRLALASYFALCSFVDDNVGKVLSCVEDEGLSEDTRILYMSDHGDNLGARGLWGKSTMFEESAGIPIIAAGPDVPGGKVCNTPSSLVDIYQTVLDCVGIRPENETSELPGRSLFELAASDDDSERIAFSEYHAAGSASGAFMIRRGSYKLIHYVGFAPQLFDLRADPEETANVANDPAYAGILSDLEDQLLEIVDPIEADRNAKEDQLNLLGLHGGRDAVIAKGTFGPTPAPGEKIEYTSAKS